MENKSTDESKGFYNIKTNDPPTNTFPVGRPLSDEALQAIKSLGYVPVARLGA